MQLLLPLLTLSNLNMAWRCSGSSNVELVSNLVQSSIVKSARVAQAMKAVDRKNYSPSGSYEDFPQPIGWGQTISAPHMHAHVLELLNPCLKKSASVLDVGCGSGYLLACFAHMVGTEGKVTGIDYVPELVDLSESNLLKNNAQLLESGRVELFVGNGWKGVASKAPFDCIHVGAAATSIPRALVDQLKDGGRMIVPIGPENGIQELVQVDKREGKIEVTNLMGVRYVPLVHPR